METQIPASSGFPGIGALAILLCISLFAPGCATMSAGPDQPAIHSRPTDASALRESLLSLGPEVAYDEAYRVAETAFRVSGELADEYRVGESAIFHNMLVNAGLRDRGLCYHWAEDMEAALQRLSLYTIDVHRVISREETIREHNAIVVTAKGQPVGKGIVLDGWRDSGDLFWGPVSQDKYPWREKPPAGQALP